MIDMENITRLPSGSLRVRIEYGGSVIAKTFAADNLAGARKWRDAVKLEIADGNVEAVEGVTMQQLGKRFLASRLGHRDYGTDESRWYMHIAGAKWAQKAAIAVTHMDGSDWLDALKEKETSFDPKRGVRPKKKLAVSTRKSILNLARQAFIWASKKGILPPGFNPFAHLTIEREDGDEDEGYQDGWHLDVNEQQWISTLYDTSTALDVRDRLEKSIFEIALWTGVRERELWCVHLDDVHAYEERPYFWVRYGSWDPIKQRYRPPKGKRGEKKPRKAWLFGRGLEAMRHWLEEGRTDYVRPSAKTLEKYSDDVHSPLKLVFPTERGLRRDGKPPKSFFKIVKVVGVIPHIGRPLWWHLLRHSCASSMVSGWWNMNWPLEFIQEMLGHAEIKTTQRYAHLAPSAVGDKAAEAHAAYLAGSSSGRHGAVTAQRPAARSPRNDGRARLDSNQRPTASETVGNAVTAEWIGRRDGVVTAIDEAYLALERGEVGALRRCIAAMGQARDVLLEVGAVEELVIDVRSA